MPSIIQTDFGGGEITPRLHGRVDGERYHRGVSEATNWMFTSQGTVFARQGTRAIGTVDNQEWYRRLFVYPASNYTEQDVLIEIASNGVVGEGSQIQIAWWNTVTGVRNLIATPDAPDTLGDLSDVTTVWDVTTNQLVIASRSTPPLTLRLLDLANNTWNFTVLYPGVVNMPPEWGEGNYSNTMAMFQSRLWFVGNRDSPNRIWATKTGDISVIVDTEEEEEDTLNLAPLIDGYSQWAIASTDRLTIGTTTGEYVLSSSDGAGIVAANATLQRTSQHGSNDVKAVAINEQVMFVNRGGAKLLAINYVRDEDNWVASEVSFPAHHMFRESGDRIVRIESAPNPDNTIVIRKENGGISICTYDRQSEVNAWCSVELHADVTDMTVISSDNGNMIYAFTAHSTQDQSYATLEEFAPMRQEWFRADSWEDHVVDRRPDGTVWVNGLERFNGMEVDAATQFGTLISRGIPQNGEIQLPDSSEFVFEVRVGFHIENKLRTLRPTIAQSKQTLAGSAMAWTGVGLRLYSSIAPLVNGEQPDDIVSNIDMGSRSLNFSYSSPTRQDDFVADVEYDPSEYSDGILEIEVVEPFICEIVGIYGELTSNRI